MDNHELDPLSAPKQKSGPLNGILRKKSDGNKTGLANNACGTNSVISVDAGSTMNANNNPGAPKLTPEQEAEKEKKRLAKKKERKRPSGAREKLFSVRALSGKIGGKFGR